MNSPRPSQALEKENPATIALQELPREINVYSEGITSQELIDREEEGTTTTADYCENFLQETQSREQQKRTAKQVARIHQLIRDLEKWSRSELRQHFIQEIDDALNAGEVYLKNPCIPYLDDLLFKSAKIQSSARRMLHEEHLVIPNEKMKPERSIRGLLFRKSHPFEIEHTNNWQRVADFQFETTEEYESPEDLSKHWNTHEVDLYSQQGDLKACLISRIVRKRRLVEHVLYRNTEEDTFQALEDLCSQDELDYVMILVDEQRKYMQNVLRNLGFLATSILRKQSTDQEHDAYLFAIRPKK